MKTFIYFLLFTPFAFGQQVNLGKTLIYPKCEKFEKKGNEKLEFCFLGNFIEEVGQYSINILAKKNIPYIDIEAKMKFVIDESGNFTSLEFFGNEFNKELMRESVEMYLQKYNKRKKKIQPAKDENGNPIPKSFYIPYVLKKNITHINMN
ncbi:hypothetical protein SAMN05443634_106254 [Chishuiella changwenlii]|uniref:TonB protein C-terminal n=1 Tax=Chishuiella changwenlii TaxID=1434701 RepID=A0A1M6YH94_9FLAO|nr:hypothetical protein [Chishuiella changwenlii]GGE97229.1 hypothetical protein GCM10010984_13460 [Chishuiella changwenlii]SHL17637.1 hypothetical protein SAMN05443634_106254 [Chishuiella changwenlii]